MRHEVLEVRTWIRTPPAKHPPCANQERDDRRYRLHRRRRVFGALQPAWKIGDRHARDGAGTGVVVVVHSTAEDPSERRDLRGICDLWRNATGTPRNGKCRYGP